MISHHPGITDWEGWTFDCLRGSISWPTLTLTVYQAMQADVLHLSNLKMFFWNAKIVQSSNQPINESINKSINHESSHASSSFFQSYFPHLFNLSCTSFKRSGFVGKTKHLHVLEPATTKGANIYCSLWLKLCLNTNCVLLVGLG